MIEAAQRQRLETRALAVLDAAVDRGDRTLQGAVDTTRDYLASPSADGSAAAAMVAALERAAGGVNVSVTLPAAAPVETVEPVAGGLVAWWSGLSTVQRAGVGLGVVAAGVWLAAKLTKKRGR